MPKHKHQWIIGWGTNNSYPDCKDYNKHCPGCGSCVYLNRKQYIAECRKRGYKPFSNDDDSPRRMD